MSFGHSQSLSQHKVVLIDALGLPLQAIECNHGKDLTMKLSMPLAKFYINLCDVKVSFHVYGLIWKGNVCWHLYI